MNPATAVSGRLGQKTRRRLLRPGALLGLVVIAIVLLAALLAPWVSRHSPFDLYYESVQIPPSSAFWFGTDDLGRSVFARVLYGVRTSLFIGISAVALAAAVGISMGLLGAYLGGRWDAWVVRLMEINLAFPSILLAIAIVAVLGPGTTNTIYAIGISTIPVYALTARSTTRVILELDYIQSARALGASHLRILLRHVLPNIASPLLVITTANIGGAVLSAAGLGYVGLGAQPPTPELGTMLSEARVYLQDAWWMATFPGLAITMIVLAMNLVGDAMRDILDVRSEAGQL